MTPRIPRQRSKSFRPEVLRLEDRVVPTGFSFPDFSSTTGLTLLGAASVAGANQLRLTPAVGGQQGAAWYTAEKQFAGLSFETTFQFQMTENADPPGGSDGLVFIIQNHAPTYLRGGGGTLGYDQLPNSLAVEFDTFQNSECNDPSASHISIHTNGTGPNSWLESLSLGSYSTMPSLMDDTAVHAVKIAYAPGSLSVYLDNMTTPKLTVAVDLAELLDLDAGQAWVGFTAATGGGWQNHDILNWSYTVSADVTTTLWASDASVTEGNSGTADLVFTINRSGDISGTATVNWATEDRTATTGSDYTAASGQATFAPNQTQATVTISVIGDTAIEPDETLALRLSGATGGSIADGVGIGTILTDDVTMSISDGDATEGSTALRLLDRFVSEGSGGLLLARGSIFGPDGNGDGAQDLYVTSGNADAILRYDGITGAFIGVFVSPGSGGLDNPVDLAFGPDGNLYVSTGITGKVFKYDGTGAFLGVPISGLLRPLGLTFGGDGNLYIADQDSDEILRYDGSQLTVFVSAGSGGLDQPRQAVFGPDGNLYVASQGTGAVLRYDGGTGAFLSVFATTNLGPGPNWLEFGTDGYLYVTARTTTVGTPTSIVRFNAATGAFVDRFDLGRDGWSFILGPDNWVYNSSNSSGNFVERLGPSSIAVFTVSLSSASASEVTVNYSTANGSAFAGSDFVPKSGTLTFAAGETTKTIFVPTLDDASGEPTETFSLTLSNPVGATIADGTGIGTILDNDSPITAPSGIVSWWTGDGNGTDLIGSNGGSLNNGASFAAGKVASGFSFNGASYVSAGTNGLPTGNSDRTMEMWVKVNAFATSESFFAGYGAFGSSNQTYHLGANSDGRLFFSQWGQAISAPGLLAGQWYHIAVSNVGDAVTLYLNGSVVASGSLTIATPASSQFYIGRIPGSIGDTRQLNGMVDEVSVYNRSLSSGEIQGIYAAGSHGKQKHSQTKYYVVDDGSTNQTYEYRDLGPAEENYALTSGNSAPRGAASNAAGTTVWVLDANKKVYVYNTSGVLQGSWTAGSLASNATVEGITTNGTDIWIVDARQDKVFKYTGAASRLSGSQNAASSFNLNNGNKDPKDIVTDGTSLWVVNDTTTDKVFKYTLSGSLLGSWTIDSANASPTGITLDPTSVNHLWIVDNGTDRVYQYDNAASRTSGSQSASTSFALAAGNTNPQGIADPPAARTANGRLPKVKTPKHDVATIDALFAMDALGRKRPRIKIA